MTQMDKNWAKSRLWASEILGKGFNGKRAVVIGVSQTACRVVDVSPTATALRL